MPRPRLAGALAAARVGLVEAGGGFGKSVLAAELQGELGVATAWASIDRATEDAAVVLAGLRRALARCGLTTLAASLDRTALEDPEAGLDALLEALRRNADEVLLVVDEASRAGGAAAGLLAELAAHLPPPHRLLLLGRRLPPELVPLRESRSAAVLGAADLAFSRDEVEAVLRSALPSGPPAGVAENVRRATGGWPAAVVLAATRLARAQGSFDPGHGGLEALVDGLLDGLDDEALAAVFRLAQLPLIDPAVAEACAGPGRLEQLEDAGLPLTRRRDGWLELPEPVRDVLAARGSLPRGPARAAAAAYADRGELSLALTFLLRIGDHDGALELLAGRRWQELDALGLAELEAVLAVLPGEAVSRHPRALLGVARAAEAVVSTSQRARLLERAWAAPDGGGDAALRRELLAETACDLARDGDESALAATAAVLDEAGPDEGLARARALLARGRLASLRGDPAWLVETEERLGQATALFAVLGEPEWRAEALAGVGYLACFPRGDLDRAAAHLAAALAGLPGPTRKRGVLATFLAQVDAYRGRLDEAEAAAREAAAIGAALGDHRIQAYAGWETARVASLRGLAPPTVERVREVERHPGDWLAHATGIEFLADAADLLARVGEESLAREFARRATERAAAIGQPELAWGASGAVEARFGDPERAESDLAAFADSPRQPPRDEWRTLLFRARAAERRGDPGAASLAARAFEAAAALGRPDLPFLHEPDLAPGLGRLAAQGGSAAAAASAGREAALSVRLLGGFEASADGRALELPGGRAAALVKLAALADGPLPADRAIETLWPGVDPDTGRRRLRNLLGRVRAACGELVVRDGGGLALARGVTDDARLFEAAAAAALAASPLERAGLARTALARYAGELLPCDVYEPWSAGARERLRRRYLDLLDVVIEDAVERGDVDEAVRLLDRAIEAEPLDEGRYLRCAELLLLQGRRGGAHGLVERAAELRARLGLPDSPRLARLRDATGAASRPQPQA